MSKKNKNFELLFSYGTLQQENVQLGSFGRKLIGYQDYLPEYKIKNLKIKDPKVLELSGKKYHPVALPSSGDSVKGMVFEVTLDEIEESDKYEVSDYVRKALTLASGKVAWVYVWADL